MMMHLNKTRALLALASFTCLGGGLLASASVQLTVDATKQLEGPPRGRGPFPGSDSPGHSPALPVRLELVIKGAELSPDGSILVDFLITNIDSDPIRLPSSVRPTSGNIRSYYLLTLWLTGDAIKKQYAVDQKSGRPFEIGVVQTSAELHDDSDATQDSALLAPGASMLVHASSRAQVNPGSHSITAHVVLERIANGSAELFGSADSETVRKTFTEANSRPVEVWNQLSLLTTAPLATANCDPLPTLEISDVRTTLVGNEWKEDRVIDATASKDGKPLPLAIVRLYIGKVLVEWTMADKRGHFLLENLTVGPYTLSIQDIGRFRLEVTPPRIHQQFFYSFSSNHGCLDWGETSD
jgi:hypothetical protein